MLAVTNSKLCWAIMERANASRGPCLHLSAFLKTKMTEESLDYHGNHLCQLATGKARSIADEFNKTNASPEWEPRLHSVAAGDRDNFNLVSATLVLYHAASFDRRIVSPMAKRPSAPL